jgi:hypothetical protein
MAFEITGVAMAEVALDTAPEWAPMLLEAAPTLFEGTGLVEGGAGLAQGAGALEGTAAADVANYEALMNAMNNPLDISANPSAQVASTNNIGLGSNAGITSAPYRIRYGS